MLEEPKLIKAEPVKIMIRSKNQTMKGLCQSCYSSNVEISLCKGQAVCDNCKNPKKSSNKGDESSPLSELSQIFDKIPDLEKKNDS